MRFSTASIFSLAIASALLVSCSRFDDTTGLGGGFLTRQNPNELQYTGNDGVVILAVNSLQSVTDTKWSADIYDTTGAEITASRDSTVSFIRNRGNLLAGSWHGEMYASYAQFDSAAVFDTIRSGLDTNRGHHELTDVFFTQAFFPKGDFLEKGAVIELGSCTAKNGNELIDTSTIRPIGAVAAYGRDELHVDISNHFELSKKASTDISTQIRVTHRGAAHDTSIKWVDSAWEAQEKIPTVTKTTKDSALYSRVLENVTIKTPVNSTLHDTTYTSIDTLVMADTTYIVSTRRHRQENLNAEGDDSLTTKITYQKVSPDTVIETTTKSISGQKLVRNDTTLSITNRTWFSVFDTILTHDSAWNALLKQDDVENAPDTIVPFFHDSSKTAISQTGDSLIRIVDSITVVTSKPYTTMNDLGHRDRWWLYTKADTCLDTITVVKDLRITTINKSIVTTDLLSRAPNGRQALTFATTLRRGADSSYTALYRPVIRMTFTGTNTSGTADTIQKYVYPTHTDVSVYTAPAGPRASTTAGYLARYEIDLTTLKQVTGDTANNPLWAELDLVADSVFGTDSIVEVAYCLSVNAAADIDSLSRMSTSTLYLNTNTTPDTVSVQLNHQLSDLVIANQGKQKPMPQKVYLYLGQRPDSSPYLNNGTTVSRVIWNPMTEGLRLRYILLDSGN